MPPSRIASRRPGGKEGREPSFMRRITAARKKSTWREKYWPPPSISQAHFQYCGKRFGVHGGGSFSLFAAMTISV